MLAACSTTSQAGSAQQSPVRIGLVIPKTGPGKAIGDELNAGFQLYLKLHGEQLGGRAVQLSTEDEGTSADSGRSAVDRLLKGSVHALSGVVSSAVMKRGVRPTMERPWGSHCSAWSHPSRGVPGA